MQLVAFLFLLGVSPAGAQAPDPSQLIEFRMKDQFKNEHTDEPYRTGVVLLIGSDKGGSEYNTRWGEAIHNRMLGVPGMDDIKILAVADVRGVPFFMKGYVRGKFPKEPEKWALTDWKGRFAQTYHWEKDSSNIMVFVDGELRLKVAAREVESEIMGQVVESLREALAGRP
ncbi:MAG: hypothetical protein HKO53_04180 [Gemmatimonadetes bacterium]|nr:hypothetical protein [Gemmatimonadota bacterium]